MRVNTRTRRHGPEKVQRQSGGITGASRWLCLFALAATVGVVVAGCGSSGGSETGGSGSGGSGLGSEYDASAAGKSKLTIWWLGDQEIPGIEVWMKGAIQAYEAKYPNVEVETVLQSTDTYVTTQQTSCRSGSGPDIWYNWGGTWSMEVAWQGCAVPNEDALSEADLKPVPAIEGTKWGGHTWVYPIEQRLYPIVYNKELFEKAGLDPESPPQDWDEFAADLNKLKSAGVQPLVTGLKDGFGGENLAVAIQRQVLPVEKLLASVAEGKMDTPEWSEWLTQAKSLKPYFNDDTTSITYSQGLARFEAGQAGMIFASPGWRQTLAEMEQAGKKVGIFKVPTYSESPEAGKLYEDTPGFQVTKFAKNPALAGNFLAFLHSPKELSAFYEITGDIPSDSRWKPGKLKSPVDKELLQWLAQGVDFYSANYYPISIDENGNFVVFQGMYGGSMTVPQAVDTYQGEIEKWRELKPAEVANYEKWLTEYK